MVSQPWPLSALGTAEPDGPWGFFYFSPISRNKGISFNWLPLKDLQGMIPFIKVAQEIPVLRGEASTILWNILFSTLGIRQKKYSVPVSHKDSTSQRVIKFQGWKGYFWPPNVTSSSSWWGFLQEGEKTYTIHLIVHLCNVFLHNTNRSCAMHFTIGYTDKIVTKSLLLPSGTSHQLGSQDE